jgi:molybdate transport system permease protein
MNLEPVLLSLEVAVPATLLAGTAALLVAALLAHRRSVGSSLLEALLIAPLVLPPTVLGYYLLVLLGRRSSLGHLFEAVTGHPLVFTTTGAVIAAAVAAFPLMLQGLRAAFESVDVTLLEAARTLGAGPVKAFARVTLPLASRGVVAAVMTGFARALGEFGVTLMVAGNLPGQTRTAALAIYDALEAGHDDEALALSLVMTLLAVGLALSATLLARRPHAR